MEMSVWMFAREKRGPNPNQSHADLYIIKLKETDHTYPTNHTQITHTLTHTHMKQPTGPQGPAKDKGAEARCCLGRQQAEEEEVEQGQDERKDEL